MTSCADNTSQGSQSPDRVLAFTQIDELHIAASIGVLFENGLLGAQLGPSASRFYVD
ncbi:MAG: hypothetical protein ACLPWG_17925 [Steroidobacteraceae bacterium]|jgi:hypothetical protein